MAPSQKGSTASTRAKAVLDPNKRIARNRSIEPDQDFARCCLRMLRVSEKPTWPGTRMRCTVCDREARVTEEGVWVRGR